MFWHLCVILRELQNLYFAKLHKFIKLILLKLQFRKIIRLKILKYYLGFSKWYSKASAMLQYLVQAVCLCGCIYNPQ